MPENIYYAVLPNGRKKRVPNTTTFLGQLNKPQLVKWLQAQPLDWARANPAWEGLTNAQVIEAADMASQEAREIGEEAHTVLFSILSGQEVQVADHALYDCIEKFLDEHTVEPITLKNPLTGESVLMLEQQLVSNTMLYGGQIDAFIKLDGVRTVTDWKSAKSGRVYPESFIQTAAYTLLMEEIYGIPHGTQRATIAFRREGTVLDAPDYTIALRGNDPAHEADFTAFRSLHQLYGWKREADKWQ